MNLNNAVPLTRDQLYRKAPSVFARHPWHGVSEQYTFIPTVDLLDRLEEQGLVPIAAQESRVRFDSDHKGYQKHTLRLVARAALESNALVVGDSYPTVSLTNSHDRGASFAIDAGLYRLVCSNGMMIPDAMAQSMRLRHSGKVDDIIEGVFTVVDEANAVVERVAVYRDVAMDMEDQFVFARAANELRNSTLALPERALLVPRRYFDSNEADRSLPKADLWTTMNVIQENVIKGGQSTRTATWRRTKTRAITSIDQDQKFNKALFVLADYFAQQRGAQSH